MTDKQVQIHDSRARCRKCFNNGVVDDALIRALGGVESETDLPKDGRGSGDAVELSSSTGSSSEGNSP